MSLPKRKPERNDMANNYESRITRTETIVEFINNSLQELKDGQANIIQQMLHVERKIDERIDLINRNIIGLDTKIDDIRKETWSQTRWVLGFIFAVLASPHAAGFVQKIVEQLST